MTFTREALQEAADRLLKQLSRPAVAIMHQMDYEVYRLVVEEHKPAYLAAVRTRLKFGRYSNRPAVKPLPLP
jgi:hypothetical protein